MHRLTGATRAGALHLAAAADGQVFELDRAQLAEERRVAPDLRERALAHVAQLHRHEDARRDVAGRTDRAIAPAGRAHPRTLAVVRSAELLLERLLREDLDHLLLLHLQRERPGAAVGLLRDAEVEAA